MTNGLHIRRATRDDADAVWPILETVIRAGETYPLPPDMPRKAVIAYWFSSLHTTYIATDRETGAALGTYYLRPNNSGGGAHVANCGYMVAPEARGRGIARALCAHSLDQARAAGYKAMQFNFVIASNDAAVHLWQKMGFETIGRLPEVFDHPRLGLVDAFIMFRKL